MYNHHTVDSWRIYEGILSMLTATCTFTHKTCLVEPQLQHATPTFTEYYLWKYFGRKWLLWFAHPPLSYGVWLPKATIRMQQCWIRQKPLLEARRAIFLLLVEERVVSIKLIVDDAARSVNAAVGHTAHPLTGGRRVRHLRLWVLGLCYSNIAQHRCVNKLHV